MYAAQTTTIRTRIENAVSEGGAPCFRLTFWVFILYSAVLTSSSAYMQCADVQMNLARLEASHHEHVRVALVKPLGKMLDTDFNVSSGGKWPCTL